MGRAPCCDSANTKKGSWSPEEDAALKNYIQKHGIGGSWIALPRKAGLKRCGKSCRLRWLNYLRPGIKHGGFTEEEDNIICTLYVSMGSRWSLIASQLPGRTDNDVKNYWNTRLKKKLLAGKIAKRSNNGNHDDTRDCNNNNRMATSRANVPNLAEFSVSVPELDCYNTGCSPYLAASSGGLPPLMEVIGYQQHCDQQQLICDQIKFPVLDVKEIPDLGASGFKSCCLSSSQEIPSLSASSSLALENKFVSWSGNGSVVQEDENSLESGSKSFYEILADFDSQGKSSEIASYVDKPDSNPQLIGSLANYYEYIRNAQCFCGCC